ncbi:MAG TPA: hypothetical protein VMG10_00010 [Gemmataceae bacterium]|nr:hypothetical protein [Gemmataceae bacterium]
MGISLYYQARRERPLSPDERAAIDSVVARYPVEALIAGVSVPPEEYNGEAFVVYPAETCTVPGIVFEGATKLPTNSEEAFWVAVQFWCQLLTEVRQLLSDAEWAVQIDDHDIWWDLERRRYDPSV